MSEEVNDGGRRVGWEELMGMEETVKVWGGHAKQSGSIYRLVMCSYSTIMASELVQHNYKL